MFMLTQVSLVYNADSSQNSSQGHSQSLLKIDEKKDEANATEENKDSAADVKTPSKPLLPKSAILKLLAELVKSYAGVAQLITDYSHTAKLSSASEVSLRRSRFSLMWLVPYSPPTPHLPPSPPAAPPASRVKSSSLKTVPRRDIPLDFYLETSLSKKSQCEESVYKSLLCRKSSFRKYPLYVLPH